MKILLCSDGHPAAENALRFLAALAPAWEAEVVLLGIVEHTADKPALQTALERGAKILRAAKVSVEILTLAGSPLAEIRRHTQSAFYDFAAIGAARAGTSLLSKKAYDLVRELDLPVLVVPDSAPHFAAGAASLLMGSGGRECVAPAIQWAIRLAAPLRFPVTLLHVLPDAPALYANLAEQEIDPARLLASRSALARQLRQERDTMVAAGLAVGMVLRQGAVVAEILDEASNGKYAMIVLGSAPRREPVRNYVMGNIAVEILRDANSPLFIVPTRKRESFFRRLFKKSAS